MHICMWVAAKLSTLAEITALTNNKHHVPTIAVTTAVVNLIIRIQSAVFTCKRFLFFIFSLFHWK